MDISGINNFQGIMNSVEIDKLDTRSHQVSQEMFAKLQLAQAGLCKEQAEVYKGKLEEVQGKQKECINLLNEAYALQEEARAGGGTASTAMSPAMMQYFEENHLADDWGVAINSLHNQQEQLNAEFHNIESSLKDFLGQYESYLHGAGKSVIDADTGKKIDGLITR